MKLRSGSYGTCNEHRRITGSPGASNYADWAAGHTPTHIDHLTHREALREPQVVGTAGVPVSRQLESRHVGSGKIVHMYVVAYARSSGGRDYLSQTPSLPDQDAKQLQE